MEHNIKKCMGFRKAFLSGSFIVINAYIEKKKKKKEEDLK